MNSFRLRRRSRHRHVRSWRSRSRCSRPPRRRNVLGVRAEARRDRTEDRVADGETGDGGPGGRYGAGEVTAEHREPGLAEAEVNPGVGWRAAPGETVDDADRRGENSDKHLVVPRGGRGHVVYGDDVR